MKTKLVLVSCVLVLAIFSSGNAYAARIMIPVLVTEELHKIEGLEKVQVSHKESMFLGYKTTTKYLLHFLGEWVDNDGYVLIFSDTDSKYVSLSSDDISKMQKEGRLPIGLPPHPKMSWSVILKGFAFWILLLPFLLLGITFTIKRIVISFFNFCSNRKRNLRSFLFKIRNPQSKTKLAAVMKNFPDNQAFLIKCLCFIALIKEGFLNEKIQLIEKVHSILMGKEITRECILSTISNFNKYQDIKKFVRSSRFNLKDEEKCDLFEAIVRIAAINGQVSKEEIRFLEEFSAGLHLTKTQVLRVLEHVGFYNSIHLPSN